MFVEYWYLLHPPRTGLRDIQMGLFWIWGVFIFVLFDSRRSELSVMNMNIYISFIHLTQVWGIFMWVWGGHEEYLYPFYSPRMSLMDIYMAHGQVGGMFLFVLLASDGSEPRVRNIHLSFIDLRQVWGLSIRVWGALEQYSYLFHSPRTGPRDSHTGPMRVWGKCIFVLLPHTGLSRESGIFISPLFTDDTSEGYLYGS